MIVTGSDPTKTLADHRCSPWTRAQAVDPIGSSTRFDHLLLVEWPLPWPSDVAEVREMAAALDSAAPGVRLMTVVPRLEDSKDGQVRVVHYRRVGTNHLDGLDHRAPMADLPVLVAELAAAPERDHSARPSAVGEAPPEVLICAHGKRDRCCGRWGTLLHVEVLAALGDEVRVWRCSHTGGHRFAPTAITLPDGRAWAYADLAVIDAAVHRRGDVAALRPHDRGTSALDPWGQAVERELFRRFGWAWLDHTISDARSDVDDDGRSATVVLQTTAGRATGFVEVLRDLPVLECGSPPEAATKSSPELGVRDFELVPGTELASEWRDERG